MIKGKGSTILQSFHAGYSGFLRFPEAALPEETQKLGFFHTFLKLSLKIHNTKDVGITFCSVTYKRNLRLVTNYLLAFVSSFIKEI